MAEDVGTAVQFDTGKLKIFAKDIERHLTTLESYTGEHMARCKVVRDLISQTYDAAAEAGIPKKPFKARMKIYELDLKKKRINDNLEPEDQDSLEVIQEKLGDYADTPLGQAALAAASGGDDDDDAGKPKGKGRKAKAAEAAPPPPPDNGASILNGLTSLHS